MTAGRRVQYLAEAAALWLCWVGFGLLPVVAASATGGWIGRTVGPRLAASRKADRHLRLAMPDLTIADRRRIVAGMWDNLGRVMAEYPHLRAIATHRTVVADPDLLHRLRDDGKPGVSIAAHYANWEIAAPAFFLQGGFPLDVVYRAPNNPYVARLLERARRIDDAPRSFAKSAQGARGMMQSLKEGRHLALLIDQKYNEGIAADFFGRPAMTSPAFVQLARRFKCPLILWRFERLPRARFRISAMELSCFDESGAPLADETVVAAAHRQLEDWIAARPEQWLWLHRRWSDGLRL